MKKLLFILLLLSTFLAVQPNVVEAQTQTYITWNLPANGYYQTENSNQGISRSTGPGWGYENGVADGTQTISEGETITFQVSLAGHNQGVFLSPSRPKSYVVRDADDNGTWVGSDNTVPFGVLFSMNSPSTVRPWEAGASVSTSVSITNSSWVRINYLNATTIRYETSTNGTDWTTIHTSAGDPSGTYYVLYESYSQYSSLPQIYKTSPAGGGNAAPTISPIGTQTITLPVNNVTFTASATDSDGTIASYAWVKISGPTGGGITTPNAASTTITGLTEGTHVYRVTATDDDGSTVTADATVIVLPEGQTGSTGNITTTIIPLSDPMILRHNAGIEDWNFQNTVPVPTATNARLPLTNYFRWNWYEIETAQGVWDWELFDRPIRAAIDNGQTFSFSIMTYNPDCNPSWYSGKPRPFDGGACMTYPLYLHQQMQAEATNSRDWIGAWNVWVPNYNSPNYLARVRAMYDSVYNHLNTTYYQGVLLKHVIEYIDNRSFGSWGEGHHYPYAQQREDWPAGRQPTVAAVDTIMAATVRAFPDIWSVAPFSILDCYRLWNTWIAPDVAKFVLMLRNASGWRVGFRRDHMGVTDFGYTFDYDYTNLNDRGYYNLSSSYLAMPGTSWTGVANTPTGPYGIDTAMMNNLWRQAPRVGEGFGTWVQQETRGEAANFPKEVRFWHYNSFGNGNWGLSYNNPSPFGFNYDSLRHAAKIAGHRLQINGGSVSSPLISGNTFNISVQWQNVGLTPVYERYHTIFELRTPGGVVVWSDTSSFNPRLFQPSTTATTVTDNFSLGTVPNGTYNLFVKIRDIFNYRIPLPLAIQGRTGDGAYLLASGLQVVSQGSNQAPTVFASGPGSITLPVSTANLLASASDPDGTIASYAWTQLSGPNTAVIGTPTAASTTVGSLIAGGYTFQVSVTDNGGLTAVATVPVTVLPAVPLPVAPTANAGADSTITLPKNTVTLIGSGTDPDGTIASYLWTKVSGPAASIVSPNLATTRLENLVAGTYVFRLTVTDNSGSTGTDDVSVIVQQPANVPPVANAGADSTVQLPNSTSTLIGSGTDSDGSIVSYSWSKISGPAGGSLLTPQAAVSVIQNLQVGTYVFRLTVTDNNGATGSDDVSVTVNAFNPVNQEPIANAGPNQTITVALGQVTLDGRGSYDPDGYITQHTWIKLSGPSAGTILSPNNVVTLVTGLAQGNYTFRLVVTDDQGLSRTDDIDIIVNPSTLLRPKYRVKYGGRRSSTEQ